MPIKKDNQEYRGSLWAAVREQSFVSRDYLFGSPSALAQVPDAKRVVAFGEARARIVDDEMAVVKSWRSPAQGAIQEQLAGGGLQQIRAADDFGDSHFGIVDGDGELICRHVIVAPDDEVAEIAPCAESLMAEMKVEKTELLAIRHSTTPAHTGRIIEFYSISARAASPGINRLIIRMVWRAGGLREIFA